MRGDPEPVGLGASGCYLQISALSAGDWLRKLGHTGEGVPARSFRATGPPYQPRSSHSNRAHRIATAYYRPSIHRQIKPANTDATATTTVPASQDAHPTDKSR